MLSYYFIRQCKLKREEGEVDKRSISAYQFFIWLKMSVGDISQVRNFVHSFWFEIIDAMAKFDLLPFHLLFIVARSVGYINQIPLLRNPFDGGKLVKWLNLSCCHFIWYLSRCNCSYSILYLNCLVITLLVVLSLTEYLIYCSNCY